LVVGIPQASVTEKTAHVAKQARFDVAVSCVSIVGWGERKSVSRIGRLRGETGARRETDRRTMSMFESIVGSFSFHHSCMWGHRGRRERSNAAPQISHTRTSTI
jgi:hypothetical protein